MMRVERAEEKKRRDYRGEVLCEALHGLEAVSEQIEVVELEHAPVHERPELVVVLSLLLDMLS